MKRLSLIFVFAIVALLVVGSFFYSSENVKPIEAELVKYPEMSPFLAGRTGFRGIRFNVDSNYYSFAFPTRFATAATYFGAIDTAATKEGWSLTSSTQQSRVYTRKKGASIGPLKFEQITLLYDLKNKEVTVIREDV